MLFADIFGDVPLGTGFIPCHLVSLGDHIPYLGQFLRPFTGILFLGHEVLVMSLRVEHLLVVEGYVSRTAAALHH